MLLILQLLTFALENLKLLRKNKSCGFANSQKLQPTQEAFKDSTPNDNKSKASDVSKVLLLHRWGIGMSCPSVREKGWDFIPFNMCRFPQPTLFCCCSTKIHWLKVKPIRWLVQGEEKEHKCFPYSSSQDLDKLTFIFEGYLRDSSSKISLEPSYTEKS